MESLRTVISRLFVDIHETPTPVNISFFFCLIYYCCLKPYITVGMAKCRKTDYLWVSKGAPLFELQETDFIIVEFSIEIHLKDVD